MKQERLEAGKWYSLYPYFTGENTMCQWWMKDDGRRQGSCSMYISWFTKNGDRAFCKQNGNLPGHTYTEATPHEAAWLAEVEKRNAYFPIEEFVPSIINNYAIY